jgi:hypothetical protein
MFGSAYDAHAHGNVCVMGRKTLRIVIGVALCLVANGAVAQDRWRSQYTASPAPHRPPNYRFVVVDPTPAFVASSSGGEPVPHGPNPGSLHQPRVEWRQYSLSASPYPYGWFGAARASQTSRRGSYYGDRQDWLFLRGR